MGGFGGRARGGGRDDEAQRLEAVRHYEILDTPRDGVFDRVAALAARLFGTPLATVTIVDEDRIWFKATQGLSGDPRQIDRAPGLCASAILQDEPYVVPDTLRDPQAMDNPLVRGELGIRFYVGAPIITADGHRLGTVNVLDTQPRQPTAEQTAGLQQLADVVMDQLELWLATLRAVREQEDNLHAALTSRSDIDRAVGMIMLARGCDASAAWLVLQHLSQQHNVKVRTLAETMANVVAGTDSDEDPKHAAVRAVLLARHESGANSG